MSETDIVVTVSVRYLCVREYVRAFVRPGHNFYIFA